MKIALLLAGHTRSYRKLEKYFYENVFNKYDVDVFISTWIGSGYMGSHSFAYIYLPRQLGLKNEADINKVDPTMDQPIDVDHVKKMFNPKAMVVDTPTDSHICQIREKFTGLIDGNQAACDSGVLNWYKVNNCNELKKKYEAEHGFKYDVVIRGRFDCAPTKLNLDVDMNMAHVKITTRGVCDGMYFSNSTMMDAINDVYHTLTPSYMQGLWDQENIPQNRMHAIGIPYHHCMDFGFYFVKPDIVRDFDTKKELCRYDDFPTDIITL